MTTSKRSLPDGSDQQHISKRPKIQVPNHKDITKRVTIVIEGSRSAPREPMKTAQESWDKSASLNDTNLVYFCDGSTRNSPAPSASCPDPKDSSKRGAYAIYFKTFCPGDPDHHGKEMGYGWVMSPVLDNHMSEAFAVVQSIMQYEKLEGVTGVFSKFEGNFEKVYTIIMNVKAGPNTSDSSLAVAAESLPRSSTSASSGHHHEQAPPAVRDSKGALGVVGDVSALGNMANGRLSTSGKVVGGAGV
ncbi:hypothetical protein QBC40DRAFT_255045 [Triangularia verruculosa]|uniref:Uncharacterized protein n=1 Tax=Triangularia verruculosa TaxID=2587418 RepID=A0AAN6XFZ8_9PEZI|nr:hypothetical protein QBC40DRAFT_255045 [Triangularia verruculosa]